MRKRLTQTTTPCTPNSVVVGGEIRPPFGSFCPFGFPLQLTYARWRKENKRVQGSRHARFVSCAYRLIRIDSRPWQAMYIGERAPLVNYHEPLSTLRHMRAALSFPTRGLGPHSSDWLAIESLPSSLSDRPCRNLGHLSPAAPAALYGFSSHNFPVRQPARSRRPCSAMRIGKRNPLPGPAGAQGPLRCGPGAMQRDNHNHLAFACMFGHNPLVYPSELMYVGRAWYVGRYVTMYVCMLACRASGRNGVCAGAIDTKQIGKPGPGFEKTSPHLTSPHLTSTSNASVCACR